MKIVVDLFNQHSGNLSELKRLSTLAFINGADVAKIQILNSKRIWGDKSREYLELDYYQVEEIFDHCKKVGIEFLATVFTAEHLEWLDKLGIDKYKIASVTSSFKTQSPEDDKALCKEIIERKKETFLSLGFQSPNDFPFGLENHIKYLFCIPKYPTLLDDEDLNNFPNEFSSQGYYGYSDHTLGLAAGIKAFMNGAKIIEKHFTFSNSYQKTNEKGHLCSFNPDSLRVFREIITELSILNQ